MKPNVDAHRIHAAITEPSEVRRDRLLDAAGRFFALLDEHGVRDTDVARIVILMRIRETRL